MTDPEYSAGLQRLPAFSLPVFASPDLVHFAEGIGARFERAYQCYSDILGTSPQVGLAVISVADWPRYAAFPTYGITHYDYPHRMVVTATEPGTFLQPAIDFIRADAPALVPDLQTVYGQAPDIDLAPNVELWITHDLGHAFQLDSGYWFPRLWLMEYFADLCSYAYVALNEPDRLPALETFPRTIRAVDARHLRYQTLGAFEQQYHGGDWTIENYLWYHGYLYETAKQAYRAAGIRSIQQMWQAFVVAKVREVSDDQLAEIFQHAQPEVAAMLHAWPA